MIFGMSNVLKRLLLLCGCFLLLVLLFLFGAFEKTDFYLQNFLYGSAELNEERSVAVIEIDFKSTSEDGLGLFSDWGRQPFADLVNKLAQIENNILVFDIFFDTQTLPENGEKFHVEDIAFSEALNSHPNVFLAGAFNEGQILIPNYIFIDFVDVVNVFLSADKESYIRDFPVYAEFDGKRYYDFGVGPVMQFLDKSFEELNLPVNDQNRMLINYYGQPYKTFESYSFVDVLNDDFDLSVFENKIVLVGATNTRTIDDHFFTPISNVLMPGVEIHAHKMQTILSGDFLVRQSKSVGLLMISLLLIALYFLFVRLSTLWSVVSSFAAFPLYFWAAQISFSNGVIITLFYGFLAILLAVFAAWFSKYLTADRSAKQITDAFSRYVSADLVKQIAKDPDSLKLGGQKRTISVFFSDVVNSTGISEKVEIGDWVMQINEYFTAMETVIKQAGGTLDKYEGDAIMGFFNAPVSQENHVIRSYITALTMRKSLKSLHEAWKQKNWPAFDIRIGINSGEAIVGNFGSQNRFDYTVMGDTVNTASRLESSANKAYKTKIMVSGFESKISAEDLAKVVLREVDAVFLPGKTQAVKIYELICLASESNAEIAKVLTNYQAGLAAYRSKSWGQAIKWFNSLPSDGPSQVMSRRCAYLAKNGQYPGLDLETMVFSVVGK
jgi:class 3 adenylate cyclase/CHASE2 domain-containing sensor protein